MHRSTAPSVALALLAAVATVSGASTLAAQVGPGEIAAFAKDPIFTKANLTKLGLYRKGAKKKSITHINFTKTPTVDKVGQYTVALTLQDLAPAYGGSSKGGQFVVTGQYDTTRSPHRFTPNMDVVTLNNPGNGDCKTLMMEPRDAICCAVGQKDGTYFVVRKSVTSAFPKPVRVTTAAGMPTFPKGSYVQAVPCFSSGVLVMIYTDKAHQILLRQIELSFDANGNLTGAELQNVNVLTKTADHPHSPTPVLDGAGDVTGLWLGIKKGRDSDMFFQPGVTLKDMPIKVFDDSRSMAAGGVCGGRMFFVEKGAVSSGSTAWMIGSKTRVSANAVATITVGTRNAMRPFKPCSTILAYSVKNNAGVHAGVSVPGFNGMFGLHAPMFVFGSISSSTVDETAVWNTSVPNLQALKGLRTSIQGLSLPQGEMPTLTNTATLEFW